MSDPHLSCLFPALSTLSLDYGHCDVALYRSRAWLSRLKKGYNREVIAF